MGVAATHETEMGWQNNALTDALNPLPLTIKTLQTMLNSVGLEAVGKTAGTALWRSGDHTVGTRRLYVSESRRRNNGSSGRNDSHWPAEERAASRGGGAYSLTSPSVK